MGNRGKEKGKKNAHRPPVETVRELQKVKSNGQVKSVVTCFINN